MMGLRYLENVTTLKLDASLCNGCRTCTKVCPHAVMKVENGHAEIADLNACMECGACARNCPADAIDVQAGVGCAAGFISGALKGKAGICCE